MSKAKTIVTKFVSFLTKDVDDRRNVALALKTIGGKFLDPNDQDTLNTAVDNFERSADSIAASLKSLEALSDVKVSAEEIKKAIGSGLDALIDERVNRLVDARIKVELPEAVKAYFAR